MPFVTADDGAQIFYKDWGSGSPVILSHGWPLNADAWDAGARFLAEHGHRVIAHDRRGHGRSTQTWHGNEMDSYADDLATLIEALDLTDLTLVGHSTGGGEIVHYVGRHGSARVAKLVLVSAVPPLMLQTDDNPEGLPIAVFDEIRAGEAADRSQLYRDLADGPFFGHNRNHDVDQGVPRRLLAAGDGVWAPRRVRVHRGVLGHRLPARPGQGRRPHPGHPRRRRPDRPVRGRRQALRRAHRPARCSRSTRAAATPCPTPTATGSTPTCSSSSTPDRKRTTMTDTDRPDTDRARARPLDDAPQLGGLGRALPGQGLHRADARATPASRSRSRRCARTPTSSPTSPCPRRSTTSRPPSRPSKGCRRSSWATPSAAP